jgi:prepilin-type processing-associated H-X9-DG protein
MKGIGCCLLVLAAVWLLFAPVFHPPERPNAVSRACLSNIKQLGLGLTMYAQDYDDRFPPASQWRAEVFPYIKNEQVFNCPALDDHNVVSYGFNRHLQGHQYDKVVAADKVVMIFDTIPGGSDNGGVELLPHKPRHKGGTHNLGFADGHAKNVTPAQLSNFEWSVRTK